MIKSAIRDHNPVIFFEHKYLYRRIKEEIPGPDSPDADYTVPIGKARIAREGRHLSVITYAAMLYTALEAAEILSKEGIELEIVDLRTVSPLDREAIAATVKKTNKVIVLHEHARTEDTPEKSPPSSTKKLSTISTARSSASRRSTRPFRFRRRRKNSSCPKCPTWSAKLAASTPTDLVLLHCR